MPASPWISASKFRLGNVFTDAAQRIPDLPIRLSKPLALHPELGLRVHIRDFADLVMQASAGLLAAGVVPGDRVAVVKTPSPDVAILQQAVVRCGAVAAMLWPDSPPEVLSTLLSRLDRPFLITDGPIRDRLSGMDLPALTSGVLTVGPNQLFDIERHRPAAPRHPLQLPPGVVLITHSSGTTGVPKLIAFDDKAIGAHTALQSRVAALLRMRGSVAFCLSYFHNRMPSALATALSRDAEMLLLDDPEPVAAAELMAELRPTVVETFPNVFLEWEGMADLASAPFADVRYFVNTFDAIHPRTVERLLGASRRRNPWYIQAYGATEMGPLAVRVHTRRGIRTADARCVGYPVPGFTRNRLEARPGTGDAQDRRGEIVVRARGAALTYVDEPVKKAPGSPDSWWRTGDLGQRGRWGCLHLLDRVVDETPDIGSNLAIEDTLLRRLPELSEALLLPAADAGLPVPVICTRADATFDGRRWATAVKDFPPLADPIHLPWATVPRTSTWKVRRLELRRQLAAAEITPLPCTVRAGTR